jgi:hypothetical protein
MVALQNVWKNSLIQDLGPKQILKEWQYLIIVIRPCILQQKMPFQVLTQGTNLDLASITK